MSIVRPDPEPPTPSLLSKNNKSHYHYEFIPDSSGRQCRDLTTVARLKDPCFRSGPTYRDDVLT